MLGALASSQEGAAKVYELLLGKTFRSVSWSTLVDCLSIYADKFKQSLQTTGSMLPEFPEGDAKVLMAYLNVLGKVMKNGNPVERKNWFPDIEPLFKLLSYENVPPFLKGALRNAITTFIIVSPLMKDTIWGYLEQYDLPVVVGPQAGSSTHPISSQVYQKLEHLFVKNFFDANRREGMKPLRPTPKREKHRVTFLSVALEVAIILMVRARRIMEKGEGSLYMDNMFSLYNLFLYIVLHMLMYATDIYFWKRYRINYPFIFNFKQGTELGFRDVFLLSTGLAVVALASFLASSEARRFKSKVVKCFS